MSLETKSIHELRALAQALGVKFKWSDTKFELLNAIDAKAREKIKPPESAPLV